MSIQLWWLWALAGWPQALHRALTLSAPLTDRPGPCGMSMQPSGGFWTSPSP